MRLVLMLAAFLSRSFALPATRAEVYQYGLIDMTDPGAPTVIPPGSSLMGPSPYGPLLGSDIASGLLGGDTGTLVRGPQPLLGDDLGEVPETWDSEHPAGK